MKTRFAVALALILLSLFGAQLVPAHAQAPRTCGGIAPLALDKGDVAKVLPTKENKPNNLRSRPSLSARINAKIPVGDLFSIEADEPTCAEKVWWWSVRYQDKYGWTAQAKDGETYIGIQTDVSTIVTTTEVKSTPVPTAEATETPLNTVGDCSQSPSALLEVGIVGVVTDEDKGDNKVFRAPNVNSDQITDDEGKVVTLPVGRTFYVLRGPSCRDGIRFWRVRFTSYGETYIGWTAEGLGTVRYLKPAESA